MVNQLFHEFEHLFILLINIIISIHYGLNNSFDNIYIYSSQFLPSLVAECLFLSVFHQEQTGSAIAFQDPIHVLIAPADEMASADFN